MVTNISQLDFNKLYTYKDYLTWQFQERVELIKGKIFKMSPAPSRRHQDISRNMGYKLISLFQGNPCKVYDAPFDVRLKAKGSDELTTVVQPDICVVCDLEKLDDHGCIGAPNLIVEILSPSTRQKDIREKFELYEENGVEEYWIVDPSGNTLLKYVLVDGKYIGERMLGEDEVVHSTLFDGLSIDLSEVFAD